MPDSSGSGLAVPGGPLPRTQREVGDGGGVRRVRKEAEPSPIAPIPTRP